MAAVSLAGCTEGKAQEPGATVERDYQVGTFDRIELAGAYEATVRTGAAASVHAKGGENILEKLIVEVEDGALKIHPEKGARWGDWKGNSKIELIITVPALRGAGLAGSGGIRIDKITGDSFAGELAGAGNLNIDRIDVDRLKIEIAGSGNANAGTGKARVLELEVAGAGEINAKDVVAEDASVSIAGAGEIIAHATKTAKVDIAGAGDVQVTGGAKCTVSKLGAGNVRCS
jgi:hypothetical protein